MRAAHLVYTILVPALVSSAAAQPMRPADADGNGLVTQADYWAVPACLAGPDQAPAGGCLVYDLDADGDVDLQDFRGLQIALTVPAQPGDWNSDGFVDPGDFTALQDCLGGPGNPASNACRVFDFDSDLDTDLADLAALQHAVTECGIEPEEVDPPFWLDTGPNNSMSPSPGLFSRLCVQSRPAFGTSSTLTNIHSHVVGAGTEAWTNYAYSGRMMIGDLGAGIGVTFLSDYPNSDSYYRLRRFQNIPSFHIAPHPQDIASVAGDIDSGVAPQPGVWYNFYIEVQDTGTLTYIRAKVWPTGQALPADWQIQCYDASANRRTAGTYGVWGNGTGPKYWNDLSAAQLACDADSDSDGLPDCADACPHNPDKQDPGVCGCAMTDADQDQDGVPNCIDQCPYAPDTDSDGDGAADCVDGCPQDPNKTSPQACGCGTAETDSDGDGTPDCLEPPMMCATSRGLHFGSVLTAQGLEVWSCGAGSLAYTLESATPWLSFTPDAGSSAGEHDVITVAVNRDGLPPGRHVGAAVLRSAEIDLEIPLTVTVNKDVVTPIARWDVVPHQRINAGQTLNCGVVAFSKAGIDRVRFAISGAGYSGPATIDVTAMTLNTQTNVWEYWIPVRAVDFASDGMITLQATVFGQDGGVRDANTQPGSGLEPLELFVNPLGSLPVATAWVDVAGSDTTGVVNDPTKPFARMSKALQALAAFQGGNADGGIVRLRPGDHLADGGGVFGGVTAPTLAEWVTITRDPDAGGTLANTRITSAGTGVLQTNWLKVEGLTITARGIIDGGTTWSLWLNDCDIRGGAGDFPFPVGWGWQGPQYYTNLVIRDQRRVAGDHGPGRKIMRNLTMINTREDNFQAVPFGVNIIVQNNDPLDTGAHADVIQSPGAIKGNAVSMHNWIFYNVIATDLHYQALFSRTGAPALDNAFVNCLFEMRAPVRPGGIGTSMGGMYDHLLFWNCTFIGTNTNHQMVLGRGESLTIPADGWLVANASVRGCLFDVYSADVGTAWFANPDVTFRDNHYITPGGFPNIYAPDTVGGTITTGDPLIITNVSSPDFGRPASAASPLFNRISPPLVPADARGVPHGASAEVGALAY